MNEQHFFLICTRKSDKYRHVSPVAFPLAELQRRLRCRSWMERHSWSFSSAPAPDDHPRWFPEMTRGKFSMIAEEDHAKIICKGETALRENDYYNLLSGCPNEAEFLEGGS